MSTLKVDTVRPVTTDSSLTLQGDSSGAGVTGAKVFGDGSLGADSITDLAGTGAPDFPNGLTLASNATGGSITGVTLDDYEEGTWTMTMHDSSSGGNQSDYSGTGSYIKIGRLVTITLDTEVRLTNLSGTPSSLTSTNTFFCSLPFTPTTTKEAVGSVVTAAVAFRNGADACIAPSINQGNSRMRFKSYSSGDGATNQRVSDFDGGYITHLTVSYLTD